MKELIALVIKQAKNTEDNKVIKGLLFQSSTVKVIEFILFDPEKLFTSVLPRLTLLPYSNYAKAILSFFPKGNYHKIAHRN